MSRKSESRVISAIQNGDEEILFYIAKKYFDSSRRWLRRNGFPDRATPAIFSEILVKVYREIQLSGITSSFNFEDYFFNSLRMHSMSYRIQNSGMHEGKSVDESQVISSCFSILDDVARKLLAYRYTENLSFEQIAARMNYSNPVIAQFEFNKAFTQFENISRARLNPE